MDEETIQEVSKGIDGFFDKLTEAAGIISVKLIEVAPDAAAALLNLVQFKGIFILMSTFIFITLTTIIGLYYTKKLWKWASVTDAGDGIGEYIPGVMLCLGSCALLLCSIWPLFEFYNWLSAFYPEGAIAFKALQAVGINL